MYLNYEEFEATIFSMRQVTANISDE